mmetsp:Transcript_58380/g.173741  ORF Transcript_58380/g.173741 Transcript_58380/m.173741 type:complete len:267 (+) Transcript_58380:70-870(+)
MTVSPPTRARCCSALAPASRQSLLSAPYHRSLTTAQHVLNTIHTISHTLARLLAAPFAARRSLWQRKRSQASTASRWPVPNLRSLAAPHAQLQTTSTRSSKPLSHGGDAGGATPSAAAAQPHSCSQRAQEPRVRTSQAPYSRSSAAPREAVNAMAWTWAAVMPSADSTCRPPRGVRALPEPRRRTRDTVIEQTEFGTNSTPNSRPPPGLSETSTGCLMKNLVLRGSVSTASAPATEAEKAGTCSRRLLLICPGFAKTQARTRSSGE